ncbi:MAG: hypothetical protein ABFC18_03155 [Rikenellaceae bacterium]
MKYDLIIVASSSTKRLIELTQSCIDSARVDNSDLNIIIVETFQKYNYEGCTIIPYKGEFNYNKCLNLGLQHAQGDYHILANNDIYFHKGWSEIGYLMQNNGYESACAISDYHYKKGIEHGDYVYEGYDIGILLCGWCIFVSRKCIQMIGKLDESFEFWHSDNVYGDQLHALGIKHVLFCNIQVDHVASQTLKTLPFRKQRKYSWDSVRKYQLLRYAK